MKAIVWFCNIVWWFWGSYFKKTTEVIWSMSWSMPVPVSCRCWGSTAVCCSPSPGSGTTAQVATFPTLSMLGCTHLACPVRESKWVITPMNRNGKRLAFIIDGNSTDLEERDTKALHGPIFQRESLNRRKRNFTGPRSNYKMDFSKLPRSIGSQKYIWPLHVLPHFFSVINPIQMKHMYITLQTFNLIQDYICFLLRQTEICAKDAGLIFSVGKHPFPQACKCFS